MTISYAIVPFNSALPEMRPLFERHWKEIATYKDIPLDPNYDWYMEAERAGLLVTYIARSEGELVGYAIFIIQPSHIHYRGHGWAMNDIIWVSPDHRGGGIGSGLMDFVEADLAGRNIHVVHMRTKVQHPMLAVMLCDRGYRLIEQGYERRL